MPAADVVLLPLCIGLSLLGVVVAVIAFARGRRGRALQSLAVALLVVALYLTGLLRLVWDAVVAVGRWATGNVFDLTAWIGFGALALAVVLWVVGGVVARRTRRAAKAAKSGSVKPAQTGPAQVGGAKTPAGAASTRRPAKAAPAQDDDMDEIEALLRSRGIQ